MSIKIASSMCCLIFSAVAFADVSDIVASNNQLGIQHISTNVNYTETGNGMFGTPTGVLDTETGPVPGFAVSISTMKGPGNAYLQAELSSSNGNTTYTGAFQGGTFGSVVGTSTATLMDFSARFGKGYAVGNQSMLTPYAELGHHEWDRGVNYGEVYTHYYWGIGLLGQYSPYSRLVLSGNALLGRTFGSNIVINSGPGLSGFSAALGASLYSRVGLSADYAFTKQVHGSIGLDYSSFSYGMSPVTPVVVNGVNSVAWEPDSKTKYTTIKFGVGFAF